MFLFSIFEDNQVWVEWDANAHQNLYSYGSHGYDVLIVDEPRKLNPGEKIAVGCQVIPGIIFYIFSSLCL